MFLYRLFSKPFNFVKLTNFFSNPKNVKIKSANKTKIRKKLYNITSIAKLNNRACFQTLDNIIFFLLKSKIAEFLIFKPQKLKICVNLDLIKIFPEANQNLIFDRAASSLNIFFFYKLLKTKYLSKYLPSLYYVLNNDLRAFIKMLIVV